MVDTENEDTIVTPRPRGFATLPVEKRRELAKRGGMMAHAAGNGHGFTSDEAKVAGRKGGLQAAANRRAKVSA